MNKTIQWIIGVIAVLALVLSISNLVGGNNQSVRLGSDGTRFPNGISVGGGVSNSAGCYQIYATSTATVGKLTASTTATIEGVDGVMMFEYGSCL